MTEFFSMGGYAVYVWSSYGAAALVLSGILISSLRTLRRREAALRALENRAPRRGGSPGRRAPGRDGTAEDSEG